LSATARCYLEGDAKDSFSPRRILICYEVPLDVILRDERLTMVCKPKGDMRFLRYSHEPASTQLNSVQWELMPKVRRVKKEYRRFYGLTMEVEGRSPYEYVRCSTHKEHKKYDDHKELLLNIDLRTEGVESCHMVIGPIPRYVELRSKPELRRMSWSVRGYGDLDFYMYDVVDGSLEFLIRVPRGLGFRTMVRIEGRVRRGFEFLDLVMSINGVRINPEYRVLAYLEDIMM